jgi:hypothetical protein
MHACVLCFPFLLWQVLFVHRYSGSMPLGTAVGGAANYLVATATMVYAQRLSRGLQDPPVDLRGPGVVVFAVGLAGNFYHHCLLSRLRADGGGGKGYKIPRGGLFGLVACPNYLFEIVGLFGLAGRSCATRRWYQSKFDEFPARIKALVPYVL